LVFIFVEDSLEFFVVKQVSPADGVESVRDYLFILIYGSFAGKFFSSLVMLIPDFLDFILTLMHVTATPY
jgi:hypothetical protein